MARKMVTRTMVTTDVTVLGVDTNIGEAVNRTFTIAGSYKGKEESALKAVKKQTEADGGVIVPVKVVDLVEHETLYGMSESDFIAHAEILTAEQEKRKAWKEAKESAITEA